MLLTILPAKATVTSQCTCLSVALLILRGEALTLKRKTKRAPHFRDVPARMRIILILIILTFIERDKKRDFYFLECHSYSAEDPNASFAAKLFTRQFPAARRKLKIFKAEEKISEAGIFHKACFRCIACKKVKTRVKTIISAYIPIKLYVACIVIYFPILFFLNMQKH